MRQSILDTAERLFAMQGFAATSIREIAADVDVNPAMVHYYFGTKQSLLVAVMENVLEPLAGSVAALRQDSGSRLSEFTSLMYSAMAKHPFLPQLIAREIFLPGGNLQQQFLENFAPRLGGRLPGILRHDQMEGRFAKDMDLNITAMLILSLWFFPLIARPVAEQVFDIEFDPAGLQRISRHVARVLEKGIRP